jgi:hypothetical protein
MTSPKKKASTIRGREIEAWEGCVSDALRKRRQFYVYTL